MTQKKTILFLFAVLLPFVNSFSASAQVIVAKDGQAVGAVISSVSQNRITLEGDRVRSIKKSSQNFVHDHDTITGDLFVTLLKSNKPQIIEFFIVTEKNKTYQMILTPKTQPGSTITIRNTEFDKKAAASLEAKTPYKQGVALLIKSMITGTPLKGYSMRKDKASFSAGPELFMRRSAVFEGDAFLGSIFSVTNKSQSPMILDEAKFKKESVVGLSITQDRLSPGESLILYLVERRVK